MQWFDAGRIPPGPWPFLGTIRAGLAELEETLKDSVDLTEGNEGVTITGCLDAYRHAILRRTLDLAQAVVASWNGGHLIGSVVCARALLETLAIFHSLLSRAQIAVEKEDWEAVGNLVDGYAFSTSPAAGERSRKPEAPFHIGPTVKAFIRDTQRPASEKFWSQICEEAHPNGKRLMSFGGILREQRFDPHSSPERNEDRLFPALHNCLYSCCWLVNAMLDFDILCEHVRTGAPLAADHPLIQERASLDRVVEDILRDMPG